MKKSPWVLITQKLGVSLQSCIEKQYTVQGVVASLPVDDPVYLEVLGAGWGHDSQGSNPRPAGL